MLALLTSITVVIPKFRLPRKGEVRHDFETRENPLFSGHFASMPRNRFVEIIAEIATDDATLYAAQAADIHDQGRYLVEKKYKRLRLAYVFLAPFVAGSVAQLIATGPRTYSSAASRWRVVRCTGSVSNRGST